MVLVCFVAVYDYLDGLMAKFCRYNDRLLVTCLHIDIIFLFHCYCFQSCSCICFIEFSVQPGNVTCSGEWSLCRQQASGFLFRAFVIRQVDGDISPEREGN